MRWYNLLKKQKSIEVEPHAAAMYVPVQSFTAAGHYSHWYHRSAPSTEEKAAVKPVSAVFICNESL